MRLRRHRERAAAFLAGAVPPTDADHYQTQMIRYADCLDHVLAVGGLHEPGACVTCDWIRIRPCRAFDSPQAAEDHRELLSLPRKEMPHG